MWLAMYAVAVLLALLASVLPLLLGRTAHQAFLGTAGDADEAPPALEDMCSELAPCKHLERYGDVDIWYATSRGPFPAGCKWRQVFGVTESALYEYWDGSTGTWIVKQPEACTLKAVQVPKDYRWNKSTSENTSIPTPATAVEPHGAYTIMKNLWYNNGRWYALVEEEDFVPIIKMSRNQQIVPLHVKNATAWLRNVKHRLVRGDSLIFDFIFFTHPTAIGHWCEMLFPLYSILKSSTFRVPDVTFVLLHLKRWHLMEWVRSVMATTLAVEPGRDLPPVILQDETDTVPEQLVMPLEGISSDTWVAFERAMVVRDLFTGGKRSFATSADAQQFRAAIYKQHGLRLPKLGSKPPRTITFQRKRANRRISNEDEVLALLGSYAPVSVVEFNGTHSFDEQLRVMSQTGLFVSAHTSNLANSPFLPPGSAVLELIQRYWSWNNIDRSFKDQTDMMGDVHHFAWRAYHVNQTIYLRPRDLEKYQTWTESQCMIEECVEAHTHVDITVNIAELARLLDKVAEPIFEGTPVPDLKLPWPPTDAAALKPWD